MIKILHCKLLGVSRQLPTFLHGESSGFEPQTSDVAFDCVNCYTTEPLVSAVTYATNQVNATQNIAFLKAMNLVQLTLDVIIMYLIQTNTLTLPGKLLLQKDES